ncbi:MAG: 4-hydroxy-3-methylbut-2-enyl diphosphate reductase [Candidatus Ancillula sp.]|nr:4-hydroxy-3-methylbut-2-enyl diphosphate reductase [Candidatus Ancillula sp.]
MEVLLAKKRGFCSGVKRAIRIVEESLDDAQKDERTTPLYVLNEIVHNKVVVQELKKKGVSFITQKELVNLKPQESLVFSAHGVSPSVRQTAKDAKLRIIDATCPLVDFVHKSARQHLEQGFQIVYIGHANHDEVEGVLGEGEIHLVESISDVDELIQSDKISATAPVVWLSQTTLSVSDTQNIVEHLRRNLPNLVEPQSECICRATQERQDAARTLAKEVGEQGAIIVVGSKNSSNTQRLADLTRSLGVDTIQIDVVTELDLAQIKKYQRIGITSGASVPDYIVDEVLATLLPL